MFSDVASLDDYSSHDIPHTNGNGDGVSSSAVTDALSGYDHDQRTRDGQYVRHPSDDYDATSLSVGESPVESRRSSLTEGVGIADRRGSSESREGNSVGDLVEAVKVDGGSLLAGGRSTHQRDMVNEIISFETFLQVQ
jgi:hypothetical protein